MPGYFWLAFDPATQRPGDPVAIHDNDWWTLTKLVNDLQDAAECGDPLEEGASVPTVAHVEALPEFDPEQFLLLGTDPSWLPYGDDEDFVSARWCSDVALARWASAMKALDPCVRGAARPAWDRYRDAITALAAKGHGLYCSADE
jgi:hypothetical protein